jgi:alpha-L-fucosidase 2
MEGSCPGKRIPPTANENDNPKGIQFSAILDLRISDGKGVIQVLDDKKLRVEGSGFVRFSSWSALAFVSSKERI